MLIIFVLMQKIEKNSLKEFATKKFGKGASEKLAEEISKRKKVSGQTVRNWFSGRSTPVSSEYIEIIGEIFEGVNPHSFFILDKYAK